MSYTAQQYDTRHGGAYDRGSADAYYGRPFRPHLFAGATYQSMEIVLDDDTTAEYQAYCAGYEETTDRKDWGCE